MKPPKMVMDCVEAKVGLAICMPLNVRIARMHATGRELVVVSAIVHQKRSSSKNLKKFTDTCYCSTFSSLKCESRLEFVLKMHDYLDLYSNGKEWWQIIENIVSEKYAFEES